MYLLFEPEMKKWYIFLSSAEKRKIIRKPRVGVQRFAQQRELQRRPQTNVAHRKGGAPPSEENKADILIKVLVFDYIEYWIEYVKVYHYMSNVLSYV